jgi:hypothetical protein
MLNKILIGLSLLISQGAWAVDTYNLNNGQLTIPIVNVSGTNYTNVVVSIGSVIDVKGGQALGVFDTYSSGILNIPSVDVGSITYKNVRATIRDVISVGASYSHFESSKINLTIPNYNLNSAFPVNDFTTVNGYKSNYLLLIGGETSITSPSGGFTVNEFYDSTAKILKNTNNKILQTDSFLSPLQTLANQPQQITQYDLNGDGINDIIIAAYGPDTYPNPGSNSVVLESSPNGWISKPLPFNNLMADGVAVGKIGSSHFLYFSVAGCLSKWQPQLVIRDTNGNYTIDNSKLPSFLLPKTGGPVCNQKEYLGSSAFDLDGDGNDDLILGTSDDANAVVLPDYVGSVVLFNDGNSFKSRSLKLPPTKFDTNGSHNTTIQAIITFSSSGKSYILTSYYQSNVLGRPTVGGGIQLIEYDNGQLIDITDQSFIGYPTFNSSGTKPYPFGGPFNLKVTDINNDGCLDIVTSRQPGLWISDCQGHFFWAYDYISSLVEINSNDRLFYMATDSDFSFIIPNSNSTMFNILKKNINIPTPVNGIYKK